MPKLSIIVPIYGVEKYLRKCLDSIKNQIMTDFEAILINDGSPDRSGEIAEEYAVQDSRFVVVHQENQGVSGARNTGLRIAAGEYISLIDSDDMLTPDMYQIMITKAEQMKVDVFCCNWTCVTEDEKNTSVHEVKKIGQTISQTEFLEHLFDSPRSIGACLWNKVFKRSWITRGCDTNFCLAEDKLFLFENSKGKKFKVGYTDLPLYIYRQRNDGLSHPSLKSQTSSLAVEKIILNMCKEMDIAIYQASQRDYLDTSYRFFLLFKKNELLEEMTFASFALKKYIRENTWGIIWNRQIYWKTRILYLMWYLNLIRK